MFYVVNNYLINLYVLSNKAVGPGNNTELINVGPMSIPESRVLSLWAVNRQSSDLHRSGKSLDRH